MITFSVSPATAGYALKRHWLDRPKYENGTANLRSPDIFGRLFSGPANVLAADRSCNAATEAVIDSWRGETGSPVVSVADLPVVRLRVANWR